MATVLTASNFKNDTISFGKHKPNTNGGYNIELTIGNGSEEILIQTPNGKLDSIECFLDNNQRTPPVCSHSGNIPSPSVA